MEVYDIGYENILGHKVWQLFEGDNLFQAITNSWSRKTCFSKDLAHLSGDRALSDHIYRINVRHASVDLGFLMPMHPPKIITGPDDNGHHRCLICDTELLNSYHFIPLRITLKDMQHFPLKLRQVMSLEKIYDNFISHDRNLAFKTPRARPILNPCCGKISVFWGHGWLFPQLELTQLFQ